MIKVIKVGFLIKIIKLFFSYWKIFNIDDLIWLVIVFWLIGNIGELRLKLIILLGLVSKLWLVKIEFKL